MPDYRRDSPQGGTYFFAVNLLRGGDRVKSCIVP